MLVVDPGQVFSWSSQSQKTDPDDFSKKIAAAANTGQLIWKSRGIWSRCCCRWKFTQDQIIYLRMIDTAFLFDQTKNLILLNLSYEDTLLNNSAAGYTGVIGTPCLPELKVNLDFASV